MQKFMIICLIVALAALQINALRDGEIGKIQFNPFKDGLL